MEKRENAYLKTGGYDGILRHYGNVVAGNVRLRKADKLVRLDPVHVQRTQYTESGQRARSGENVVDHALEVESNKIKINCKINIIKAWLILTVLNSFATYV